MSNAEPDRPEIDTTPVAAESDVAFPRLDPDQIETLRVAGRTVALATGEIVFSPGELDYDLIVVITGCVEIVDAIDTPHERVLVSYGPRQFAGELNLITLEPMLIGGDKVLRAPTVLEAATALNLRAPNKTAKNAWDTLIVGGGPGGLGAAVYAATEGLSTFMIDSTVLGGQASISSRIENYLGFPAGISGSELAERAIA